MCHPKQTFKDIHLIIRLYLSVKTSCSMETEVTDSCVPCQAEVTDRPEDISVL